RWDVDLAHIYHWLHSAGNFEVASASLESEKPPLQNRIWYYYAPGLPGQGDTSAEPTGSSPFVGIARNGVRRWSNDPITPQDNKTSFNVINRNDAGNVISVQDEAGRVTTYEYFKDANGADTLDLQRVRRRTGGTDPNFTYDTLVSYANYTATHLPQ